MVTIKLPLIDDPNPKTDSILHGMTPFFEGNESESLVCGACGEILGRNISTRSIYEKVASKSGRLILKCKCAANNKANVRRVVDTNGGGDAH